MQFAITPYDSRSLHLSSSKPSPTKDKDSSRMPSFFNMNRTTPSPKKTSKYCASSNDKQQQQQPRIVHACSTASESYPDTDELTLDGMTLSGLTFGDNTVSTINLDSVIRRSVNLGGDHKVSPEISIRKTANKPSNFRLLNTDDIDVRIEAYRHAVSSYREQHSPPAMNRKRISKPTATINNQPASSNSIASNDFNDDYFDEYTLTGVSLGDGDSHYEPRTRAARPVDMTKRPKAATAASVLTNTGISSRRVQEAQSARKLKDKARLANATKPPIRNKVPPTYIAPRMEQSRTNDSSEKENKHLLEIKKTYSMSSVDSFRTSSTQTTKNMKNLKAKPTLLELPPSTVSMKILPADGGKRRSSLDKQQQLLSLKSSTGKKLLAPPKPSSNMPNPYSKFADDDGPYEDPPLLSMDESYVSSIASTHDDVKKLEETDEEEETDTELDDTTADVSMDMDVVINPTDKDLMEQQEEPGCLRLTIEGLQEHDRLMVSSVIPKAKDTGSLNGAQYNSWSQNIEKAKQRISAKPNVGAAVPATPSPGKVKPLNPSSATTKSLSPTSQSSAPKKPIATSFSRSISNKVESKKRRGWRKFLFGSRRKQQAIHSPFAQDLLERERLDEECLKQREIEEKKELQRIESKRQAYLERARQKEAALPDKRGSIGGGSMEDVAGPAQPLAVIEESDDDCSVPFDVKPTNESTKARTTKIVSAIPFAPTLATCKSSGGASVVSASSLPPCVVCRVGDRTHISTPCMHFAFCGNCVFERLERERVCPVCAKQDVAFAQVSV
ncbi:hypothetical protein MPSEU_000197000 [Mayamaea pseudoterrestris]|nr:hypothetical protein MPSEU_000197000 [Mayamaea pseudoterrestris]